MNITEFMSFDLEWFTTLPGLLITGGVIVLLIALIIFIVSNKKTEKKNEEAVPSVDTQNAPVTEANMATSTMPMNNQFGVATMPMENNIPANNVASMDFGTSMNNGYVASTMNNMNAIDTPIENSSDNVFKATSFNNIIVPTVEEPQVSAPELNTVNSVNNVVDFSAAAAPSVPVVEPVVTASVEHTTMPAGAPVVTPVATPVVEPQVTPIMNEPVLSNVAPVVNEVPVVPSAPVAEEKPMIYGGVNPVNTISSTPEVKPVIYGGANPLENTATLPRMTSHEAYNASSNTINSAPVSNVAPAAPVSPTVEPVVSPVVESQVPPVVSEPVIPAAAPVASTMPMTGADMFATNDVTDNNASSSASSEIETLEF